MNKVFIVLWTTSECNLSCKYCYATQVQEKTHMDFETAKKIIDYFKNSNMKIQFTGGEPLLNFDLIKQVYSYIQEKKYKASFQMQTNATLIDNLMARELKQMNISIGVSMDGPPEINEVLRGKTNHLIKGMHHLAQAGITVNLNSVVTSINVSRLSELADVALYFGNVAGVGLDLLRHTGRAKDSDSTVKDVTERQLTEGLVALHERCEILYKYSGKKLYIRSIQEAKKRLTSNACVYKKAYCYASTGQSYVVLPNGKIYPCGSLTDHPEYYIGNLNIDENIKQISLPSPTANECEKCKYNYFCTGTCPSRSIINGSFRLENSLDCALKKISFKIAEKLISS
ncbi:radical SAM/SPASM domain-containing protein [Alkalibacter mobilis]|uniref:radical SAM/SPASM domain-containing protein n=1 Tax=Alkalibacter mobilis TaxID=2787712 RepID=UPI00189DAD94|nr:radical SAM protein [Alkalibacter mobilis]MBF7095656.1 radical SAM protein [Alkalibacter mobilis]